MIALGCDHGGYELRNIWMRKELNIKIMDVTVWIP